MANMIVDTQDNVIVKPISEATATTTCNDFPVNSTSPSTGTALASPGQPLTVQIGLTNDRGDPDTCTIVVTDPYGNKSFRGVAVITWNQDDNSIVWTQFSDFPLQADQSTPMDKCNYSISVSNTLNNRQGTKVSAQVSTL